jgi:hypothetical protein
MGLMDDGPEQQPLPKEDTQLAILELLPAKHYDLVITHNPSGEYTRHLRHEEVGIAVNDLWQQGKITTNELWMFAYEDAGKKYFPRPVENADYHTILTKKIWLEKYSLITETYGFEKNSWEALTTPRAESFWQFRSLLDAQKRLHQFEIKRKQLNESPGII